MGSDDADVEGFEDDLFDVRHPWLLRWELGRLRRLKRKFRRAGRDFTSRCIEVVIQRPGLALAFPYTEEEIERFDEDDIAFATSLLESYFAKHSLVIEGVALRFLSDDGKTEVTRAMVTFR